MRSIRRRTRYALVAAAAVVGFSAIPITAHIADSETDVQKCTRILNDELDQMIADTKAGKELDPDPKPVPACDKLSDDQKADVITDIWTERQDEIWDSVIYNELRKAHTEDELEEAKRDLGNWFKDPAEWPEETP